MEACYALFVEEGQPELHFVSEEEVKNATAEGLKDCLMRSMEKLGVKDLKMAWLV